MKQLTVETEREVDGRWIAEVPELPGLCSHTASALLTFPNEYGDAEASPGCFRSGTC